MLSWFWFHFCSPGFIWSEETFHLSKQQVCQCRETVTCLPTEILVFPQVLVLHMHIRTFLKSTKPVFSNNTRICVWFESTHSSHLAALEVWVAPWITPTSHLKLHAWPDSQGACLYPTTMGGSSAPFPVSHTTSTPPNCSQTWTSLDLGFQNLLENSGSESSMVHTLSAHQTPNLVSFQIYPMTSLSVIRVSSLRGANERRWMSQGPFFRSAAMCADVP
jgi:hypothetical protein